MKIGRLLNIADRKAWRSWLERNHASEKEIWLVYYRKDSGKARIPYDDAVEEALCFGWIDSTVKGIDDKRYAQRFSPRKSVKSWSEPNKERLRRLLAQGKVIPAGLAKAPHIKTEKHTEKFSHSAIPARILSALKKDKATWQNFSRFPDQYKRIRIAWIARAKRPAPYKQRLAYFLKMTKQNKKYGMMR